MGSELLSCVQLFMTLWAAAHQAPLSPWDFPSRNTGVGCHFLLCGIFLTQGSNLCLSVLCWQVDSLPLNYLGSAMGRMAEITEGSVCFACNICASYFLFIQKYLLLTCLGWWRIPKININSFLFGGSSILVEEIRQLWCCYL